MSRFATALKLGVIAIVTVVMSIALVMINSTISDRQNYRNQAVESIESSYAGPQSLIGPVLVRPYTETTYTLDDDGHGKKVRNEHVASLCAFSFPRNLDITGQLKPSDRRHGLYSVTVYELDAHLAATIPVVAPKTTGTITWADPYLALSVADVRGFTGRPAVTVNGTSAAIIQGADTVNNWTPNLHIPLTDTALKSGTLDIAIDLALNGTERLSIAPIADANHIQLTSPWHSPLFDGQFLPRTRSVDATGFNATWEVPSLATGAQLQLQSANKQPDMLSISLLNPIDPYKLSDRATKYGILFILLTFGGFFLFEMLKSLPIHPIQYLLVGFGLAIFFLLLISFSEHMAFATAYLISSAACIGLLTFYLAYVLRSTLRSLFFGSMLTTLYAAVYGLLISEDNALILGSLLLFAVLAVIMVITRNVDWYKTSPTPTTAPLPPSPPPSSDLTTIRLTH